MYQRVIPLLSAGMNRFLAAASVLGVLAIAGCAAQPATEATPTPTIDANAQACADFTDASIEVGEAVVDGTGIDMDIPATFDTVALSAEGEVRERILTLIDNLPDKPHMIVWMDNRDAYSADLEAVQRACAAEGHDIDVALLVAAND